VESVETTRSSVVVNLIDNVRSRLLAFDWQDGSWHARSLPVPDSGVIEFADQPWNSDVLCYSFSDFLTPTGLYRLNVATGEHSCLRQQPAAFDASRFVAEQCWATASDGVDIPYFVVRARDTVLDGQTPTLLYGYGGFEVPMMPYYVENFGAHWLEKGGAFVLACIRGGGEFGPGWHQAAQGINRPVSFDDFCSVAEALIGSGLTSPDKLGIEGGSNGGLLVAACMVRRPELFKAVVCEVPLLDMLRYTELLAGASWIDEYGDPADPHRRQPCRLIRPITSCRPRCLTRCPCSPPARGTTGYIPAMRARWWRDAGAGASGLVDGNRCRWPYRQCRSGADRGGTGPGAGVPVSATDGLKPSSLSGGGASLGDSRPVEKLA
jgi:prolyl oligopeptidase